MDTFPGGGWGWVDSFSDGGWGRAESFSDGGVVADGGGDVFFLKEGRMEMDGFFF